MFSRWSWFFSLKKWIVHFFLLREQYSRKEYTLCNDNIIVIIIINMQEVWVDGKDAGTGRVRWKGGWNRSQGKTYGYLCVLRFWGPVSPNSIVSAIEVRKGKLKRITELLPFVFHLQMLPPLTVYHQASYAFRLAKKLF